MLSKPGNSKTQYMFSYNRNFVKVANERLRKLEKVSKLSQQSAAYRSIQKYAIEEPNSMSAKFYTVGKDGSIRFINKTAYNNLSSYEKKRFNEVLNNFLDNATSTKLGVKKAQKDAFDEFMENHPSLDWSYDEYQNFWKKYDQMRTDTSDKNAYDRLTQLFQSPGKFSENLTDDKIREIADYTNDERRYSDRPSRGRQSNKRR